MTLNPEQLFDEPVGNYGFVDKRRKKLPVTSEHIREVTGAVFDNREQPEQAPLDLDGLNVLYY